MKTNFSDVETYINSFPEATGKLLQELRTAIKEAAPEAREMIKYAMPTYIQEGNLVHFAAYKNHIGFYATPTGHSAFEKELSSYKRGKGSVQFPIDQPLPLKLIREIVRFRVLANKDNAGLKKTWRTCNKGHQYDKSSNCPVCPICAKERASSESFLSLLGAPARRALENEGINTEAALSQYTEEQILRLHGLGKSSLPILREVLAKSGLHFRT